METTQQPTGQARPAAMPSYAPPPQRRQPAAQPARQAAQRAKQMAKDPTVQAREILHVGFTAAPLIAGADKFTQALSDWDHYVDPRVPRALGMSPRQFMKLVGAIEVGAGLLVAAKPKWGSLVVAGWLGGIIGNLVSQRNYYDIALRDFGLMLGALALSRLEAED